MSASRSSIAEDLWCYHEAATADWILHCSEDEFVRVCDVADFLTFEGPALRSGASMMIAKALALAAVYIHEGVPRDLVRSRRDLTQIRDNGPRDERWPDYEVQNARPAWFAVGDDAIAFWAPDPAHAKQGRTRREEVFQAQAAM